MANDKIQMNDTFIQGLYYKKGTIVTYLGRRFMAETNDPNTFPVLYQDNGGKWRATDGWQYIGDNSGGPVGPDVDLSSVAFIGEVIENNII